MCLVPHVLLCMSVSAKDTSSIPSRGKSGRFICLSYTLSNINLFNIIKRAYRTARTEKQAEVCHLFLGKDNIWRRVVASSCNLLFKGCCVKSQFPPQQSAECSCVLLPQRQYCPRSQSFNHLQVLDKAQTGCQDSAPVDSRHVVLLPLASFL